MLIEAGDIKTICYELISRLRQYNNFSICQYSIKYPWYIQDFIKMCVCVCVCVCVCGGGGGGGGGGGAGPVGWTMCSPLITSSLVRMLEASCFVCNNLLFIRSFYSLNLIFTYYSSVTSWYVLSETTNVAVDGSLYDFCRVSVTTMAASWPLQSWISTCYSETCL